MHHTLNWVWPNGLGFYDFKGLVFILLHFYAAISSNFYHPQHYRMDSIQKNVLHAYAISTHYGRIHLPLNKTLMEP